MTVAELVELLQILPGDLEVVAEAESADDGRLAVAEVRSVLVEDRGDGRAVYLTSEAP